MAGLNAWHAFVVAKKEKLLRAQAALKRMSPEGRAMTKAINQLKEAMAMHRKLLRASALHEGDQAVADFGDGAAVDPVAQTQGQNATVRQADQGPAGLARADRADDLGAVDLNALLDGCRRRRGGGDPAIGQGAADLGFVLGLGRGV